MAYVFTVKKIDEVFQKHPTFKSNIFPKFPKSWQYLTYGPFYLEEFETLLLFH